MFVTILLDFGQDYRVSMTPEEARKVWMQLNDLFKEPAPRVKYALDPQIFKPVGKNGYEATAHGISGTEAQYNAEAKAEESPETLRDSACATDCNCICYSSRCKVASAIPKWRGGNYGP
jgi:hypothetical protein